MNTNPVIRLFPDPGPQCPLEGLYLQSLVDAVTEGARPYVYTNYVASLDGRIAVADPDSGIHHVPRTIANPRDWRLYQELAAGADVLLVSGRYLRELAIGKAQAGLPVSNDKAYRDLHDWRLRQGLAPQPAVVILSRSLDLPWADLRRALDREAFVATGERADPARIREIEACGLTMMYAGAGDGVDGARLIDAIGEAGWRRVYSIAGPQVLNTLLDAEALDRLYLTQVHRLLGGASYDTLLEGGSLAMPADFRLRTLYYDHDAGSGVGQTFGIFDRAGS